MHMEGNLKILPIRNIERLLIVILSEIIPKELNYRKIKQNINFIIDKTVILKLEINI